MPGISTLKFYEYARFRSYKTGCIHAESEHVSDTSSQFCWVKVMEFASERELEPEMKEEEKKPLIRHNVSYFKAINVSWKTSLISPAVSCRGSLTEAGASPGTALATHLLNSANTTYGKGSKWYLFLAPGLTWKRHKPGSNSFKNKYWPTVGAIL